MNLVPLEASRCEALSALSWHIRSCARVTFFFFICYVGRALDAYSYVFRSQRFLFCLP